MPLALDELVGGAFGPDRLTDAAKAARAGVPVDELAPRGDDARRVETDVRHVRECHAGRTSERVAQAADLFGADDDERRLAGGGALGDESCDLGHEVNGTVVEDGLVPEGGSCRSHWCVT